MATAFFEFKKRVGVEVELVVVLDGESSTVTQKELSYLNGQIQALVVVRYTTNRGKGYAIRKGVEQACGEIIIYTDIDFPYSMLSMLKLYEGLKNNQCDVAVGVKDKAYYNQVPKVRKVISYCLRFLVRLFLSMPITDTQCGLKGFNSKAKPLFLATTNNRYLFDLEFIRNCYKSKKLRVEAIPIQLNENIQFRRMNYKILLPEFLNFLKLLLKKG